uniref:Putative secreted protein n=1 Tax=Panstrongylus lignarius TaxID=156445 RepID=A0A224XWF1_9HEMI
MMKHFLILVSALVLAQGLKEEVSKNAFENDAEQLLEPFLKGYFELNNLIEEVKQHQQTQKMSSLVLAERLARVPPNCLPTETQFVEARDSDACNNLTHSLAKAVNLAETIGSWAYKAGLKVCGKVLGLTHCGNINPVAAIQCVVKDIHDLKELLVSFKPDVLKFKEEVVALAKELKEESKKCLGVQKQADAVTEQMIIQAQLCDATKLQRLH